MTIFARNPDNGQVKWAYQMTPHDEWDYDGVNENVLFESGGKKLLAHFDRNGFGYTLDRTNGKVLVAQPYGPVNWAKRVDLTTGVPEKDPKYGTTSKKNTEGICPAAIGFKDQQPAAYSPITGLFYVPANHICMDYEGVEVKYTAGQPYVGAIVRMFPGPGGHRGSFIAWDPMKGKAVWENKENLAAYGGALTTAGGLVFYGTMEGWLKALDQDRQGPVAVQDPVGHHRQPDDLQRPGWPAVCGRALGHRWLGRHRRSRRHRRRRSDRRSGRARRVRRRGQFSTQGGVLTVFALKNPPMASKHSDSAEAGGDTLRSSGGRFRVKTAPGCCSLRRRSFHGAGVRRIHRPRRPHLPTLMPQTLSASPACSAVSFAAPCRLAAQAPAARRRRSPASPGLRRSGQHAALQPEGRRVRAEDRRADRQGVEREGRVCLVAGPAGLLRPCAERPLLRCGHRGSGGPRHGRGHQAVLPLRLRLRRPGRTAGSDIKSLADPRLKKLKIGVNILNSDAENTPPAMALSRYGVVGNLTGFSTFYTDSDRPGGHHQRGGQEGHRCGDRLGTARRILRQASPRCR